MRIHAYGLCIALGVVAAVWISNKRWLAKGGTSEDITALATWGVPCGIIGSRIYSVITDFELYRHHLIGIFEIWDGGLGIWGGILGGVGAGAIIGKRRGLSVFALMDMVAPALAIAQAIGRFGNYFNQELFGRPTTLPWGLKIDVAHRPLGFENYATFHPTFLYEAIWNALIGVSLILFDRRYKPRPPQIFLMYVAFYTFGRFFIEHLRIDFAHKFLGLRLNDWTSIVVFIAAVGCLIAFRRKEVIKEPLVKAD